MPVQPGIVVKVHINAPGTGAIKVARQRRQRALQIGWAAGGVVPFVPDFFTGRFQWIAVAVERAGKRHPGIDAVVKRPLDHIGESRLARHRQHAPVPHHVADGRAAFAVSLRVGKLVGLAD